MRAKKNRSAFCSPGAELQIGNDESTTSKLDFHTAEITKSKEPVKLIRLPQVLDRFPVGRSTWYAGIRSGIYPQPILISRRAVAWTTESVDKLIRQQSGANGN